MDGGKITGNNTATGGSGGGVYNGGTGTFNMNTGTEISGNTADYGGGVYNLGTFDMIDGGIIGNTADYGGGVLNGKTFTMDRGKISGNNTVAGGSGGSAYIASTATLEITNGAISGNHASDEGGGIYTENFTDYGILISSDYQNILTDTATAFTSNTANAAYEPPAIVYEYANIKYSTTSVTYSRRLR